MVRFYLIWGLSFLIIFSPLNSKDHEKKPSYIKYIPGLYQIKEKKILKGGLLFSSFFAGIAGMIIYNREGNNYYDRYLISKNIEEIVNLRKKTEESFKKRNIFILSTALVYLLHLFDLKFSNRGIKSEIKNNSISFGLYYNF